MERWQYLLVLVSCVVVTLPLELAGARVYRQPRLLALSVLPVAVVFLAWDALAIAAGVWNVAPAFVTGLRAAPGVPIEEALFFVVIPLCGVLTYEAVGSSGRWIRRLLRRQVR